MSEAIYIRLDEEELGYITALTKKEKITRSEAIKKLLDYALKKIKIEDALKSYKEGKNTIRESAEIAGLRYFEFFDILTKEGLIGTSPHHFDLMLSRLEQLKEKP